MKNILLLTFSLIVSLAATGCARPLAPPAIYAGMGGYGAYGSGGYGFTPGMTGASMPYGGSVYVGTGYDPRTHASIAAYDQARLAARGAVAPCTSCSAAPVVVPPPAAPAAETPAASADAPTGDRTTRAIIRQLLDHEERLEEIEGNTTH